MLIDFCIPIYNENKLLEKNAAKVFEYCQKKNFPFSWRLVLIINGSTDNSLALAEKFSKASGGLVKVFKVVEKGKGLALREYWSSSEADIFLFMDIDLAASLDDVPALLKPLVDEGYDLAIGSRLLAESRIRRDFFRELTSQGYNFLSRLILGHKFSDLQCGFKAIKKTAFEQIAPYLKNSEWFFDTELLTLANFFTYRVKEIPVDWEENRYDQRKSKINLFKDSLKFLFLLLGLKKRIIKIKRQNKPKKDS